MLLFVLVVWLICAVLIVVLDWFVVCGLFIVITTGLLLLVVCGLFNSVEFVVCIGVYVFVCCYDLFGCV